MAYAQRGVDDVGERRLHGVLNGAETAHTGLRAVNDLEMRAAEMGLSFVNAQENRVGVAVRAERGRNPRPIDVGGIAFNDETSKRTHRRARALGRLQSLKFDGRVDYAPPLRALHETDYAGPPSA